MATPCSSGRVLLLGLLLGAVVLPGIAAAESRSGGSIVVGANETVEGDLDAFGGTVIVRGTVTGDLNAFAGSVRIDGTVGGDVDAAGGDIVLGPDGRIGGNFAAGGGTVRIDGTVAGDAEVGAEEIRLGPTARIDGDLTYGGNLSRATGATIGGSISEGDVQVGVGPVGGLPALPGWLSTVYGMLVNLALGAVLILAFPRFSRSVRERAVGTPFRSGGVGLLTVIAVPVALVLLAITIVGIPLMLLGTFLFGVAVWIGALYGRIAVGSWLVSLADIDNQWLDLVVGVLLIGAVTQLPWIGGAVELAVFLLGFGALAATLSRRFRRRRTRRFDTTTAESDETPS